MSRAEVVGVACSAPGAQRSRPRALAARHVGSTRPRTPGAHV